MGEANECPKPPFNVFSNLRLQSRSLFNRAGGGGGVVLRLVAGSPTAQLAMNKDYKSLLSLNGLE